MSKETQAKQTTTTLLHAFAVTVASLQRLAATDSLGPFFIHLHKISPESVYSALDRNFPPNGRLCRCVGVSVGGDLPCLCLAVTI